MYTIESTILKVSVRTKGAELDSIFNTSLQLEYLWSGDPAFWGKKSPILFPIVGTLKKDTYIFNDKEYHLNRHGFARDMEFAVTKQQADSITLTLESNAETWLKFPFSFRFDISYTVNENRLEVAYRVTNTDSSGNMYFSVGAHPAFKVPLVAGTAYEDYSLVFNEPEPAPRWPISKDGLIEATSQPLLDGSGRLDLHKNLFQKDALVFKDLRSDKITLQSKAGTHGWSVSFPGFPFMGIWAAKDADFVCIEPWCGIADGVDSDQQLEHKEGIVPLPPAAAFARQWTLEVW